MLQHGYERLLNFEVSQQALKDVDLLEKVAIHKSIYFASGWANYGAARKSTLKLFPPDRILKELEKDYILMESMFFKEIPDWKLILESIKSFEGNWLKYPEHSKEMQWFFSKNTTLRYLFKFSSYRRFFKRTCRLLADRVLAKKRDL